MIEFIVQLVLIILILGIPFGFGYLVCLKKHLHDIDLADYCIKNHLPDHDSDR